MFTLKVLYADGSTHVIQGERYTTSQPHCGDHFRVVVYKDGLDTIVGVLDINREQLPEIPISAYGVYVMNDQGRTVDRIGWPGMSSPAPEPQIQSVG